MQTKTPHPQERIARELLTQSPPLFLGVDGEGAAHYWDSYEQAVAVVDDGDPETFALSATPCETLADWCEHVRHKRGWETGPRVSASLADQFVEALR